MEMSIDSETSEAWGISETISLVGKKAQIKKRMRYVLVETFFLLIAFM